MDITAAQITLQMLATARATQTKTSGSVNVGQPTTTIDLADVINTAYAAKVTMGKGAVVDWSPTDCTFSADVAGTSQVETATAAGTTTQAGNVAVTITSGIYSDASKTVQVAVANADTATAWATKVRAALTADADINAAFVVSGATTAIILTDRLKNANDATLNIALANGTPDPGITPAATSANTTPGVASVVVADGDGLDWEGSPLLPLGTINSMMLVCESGSFRLDLPPDESMVIGNPLSATPDYFVRACSDGIPTELYAQGTLTALAHNTVVYLVTFGIGV